MVSPPNIARRSHSLSGVPLLTPPPDQLQVDALVRKLVSVAIARVVIVTLSLGALFVIAQLRPPHSVREVSDWEYLLIGSAYLVSVIYAGLLRYRALVPLLGYIQIVLDTAIVSVLVLMTGGIESVFTVAYVFVVLGAAITLYRRGAVMAAVCIFLLFGTVILLQVERIVAVLPRVDSSTAIFAFVMHTGGIGVVAFLASTLTERLRITDLRLAEKKIDLERLEELHAAILRSLPAGLMTIDEELTIRYVNDAALVILRMSWDQLVGQRLMGAVPFMGRTWQEHGLSEHPFRSGRPRGRYERGHLAPDGTVLKIGFSFAPLSLAGGAEWSGFIVVFQDVTDIVRLKEAVERAERLATVGKFAAGLAHEVRNPLASMCASIDVLEQSLDPPVAMKRLMSNVVKEADRLNVLITHFLSFAKPRELEAKEADLSSLVRSVVEMYRLEASSNVCIDLALQEGLVAAIDEDQVRQVTWNLIRNAGEAMKRAGGTLTIRTFEREGEAVLVVRDTGVGVPPEQVKNVFDPFFTTKQGGSGLGLAIAHAIVESHGGSMMFESHVGVGTEVSVRLPTDLGSVDLVQGWDDTSNSSELEPIA